MDDPLNPHPTGYDGLAEGSALGSVMLSAVVADDVFGSVRPQDFYLPRNRLVADAMLSLLRQGQPVDVVAVSKLLGERGDLSRAGGAEYLHELCGLVVTPVNAGFHARVVVELAQRRRLYEAGLRISQMGASSEGEIRDLVDRASRELDAVTVLGTPELVMLSEALLVTVQSMTAGAARVIPSPWRSLNANLGGGFRGGWLYVVGARPSIGKTAIGLQIALAMAKHGSVGISSLEMSAPELHVRAMAQGAGVSFGRLTANRVTGPDWEQVARWRAVTPLPVLIDDRAGVSVFDIGSFARKLRRRHGMAGLVIDYLQLVSDDRSKLSRVQQITDATRALKILARDLDIPVVLLSQLNRDVEHRTIRKPQLSDLRDSGSIEQDADVVLLLHREPDPKTAQPGDVMTIFLAKNRQGRTGVVDLIWDGEHVRALDFDAKPPIFGPPELGWNDE